MSMIKIGMIGIAAVFLALLLKKEKGELALLVGIAASVLIFGYTPVSYTHLTLPTNSLV